MDHRHAADLALTPGCARQLRDRRARRRVVQEQGDSAFGGQTRLREAIKRTVANAGYEHVLVDPFTRALNEAARLVIEDLGADSE